MSERLLCVFCGGTCGNHILIYGLFCELCMCFVVKILKTRSTQHILNAQYNIVVQKISRNNLSWKPKIWHPLNNGFPFLWSVLASRNHHYTLHFYGLGWLRYLIQGISNILLSVTGSFNLTMSSVFIKTVGFYYF